MLNKKMNLLFIFTDEQAVNTTGAYGNKLIHTPNMDRLAKESVVFENAYVTQPVCTPSRSSLLTGLYPHKNGCHENNAILPENIPCFPELGDFSDYKKGYVGKWHLGNEIFAQHGFDVWKSIEDNYRRFYTEDKDKMQCCSYSSFLKNNGFKPDIIREDGFQEFSRDFTARLPEEYTKAAYVADEACKFIDDTMNDPFILYVNFLEPHMPFYSCRDEQYDAEEIPLPKNYYNELTSRYPLKPRLLKQAFFDLGFEGRTLINENDWKTLVARYWGLVSLVDTQLGKILDKVEKNKLKDNTIIVFTSDHGDMMGSHRLLAKSVMFEEAVKVPLLIKIPNAEFNTARAKQPVSQIDLVPTILNAMGQDIPKHLQGSSLLPMLEGDKDSYKKDVFIEWNGYREGNVDYYNGADILGLYRGRDDKETRKAVEEFTRTIITQEGFKLNFNSFGKHELYNLNVDKGECSNLFYNDSYSELIKKLTDKIIAWQYKTDDNVVFDEITV